MVKCEALKINVDVTSRADEHNKKQEKPLANRRIKRN